MDSLYFYIRDNGNSLVISASEIPDVIIIPLIDATGEVPMILTLIRGFPQRGNARK
jgi:hypothetical protein